MKAFLLAAGVGSRLGELTERTPKCLLPVAGRPLLDYWFESFASAGISQVLVNLHHHADQVRDFLRRYESRFQIETLFEATLLGSAGTVRTAWDFVSASENFFVIYADNFTVYDLKQLAEFHHGKGNPVLSLVVYETGEPQRCGIVERDAQSRVISFEEKPQHPRSNLANAGIYLANRRLLEFLPDHTPADFGFHVLPRLTGYMYATETQDPIQDIGTPEGYARAQRIAANLRTP